MPHRRLLAVLLACVLPVAASAAEPPRELIVRVAVSSPSELLTSADDFVSAATAGGRSRVPPGTIPMLSAFVLPFSLGVVEADREMQILVLTHPYSRAGVALVVTVDDFSALIEDMENRFSLEESEDGGGLARYEGGGFGVADLGGGRAVVASPADVLDMLGDASWIAEGDGESLVLAEFPLHSDNRAVVSEGIAELVKAFVDERDSFVEGMRELHIAERVAEGLADLAGEWLPELAAEIALLERVELRLDFDEEKLTFRFDLPVAEGSLLGGVAARLEESGDVDASLLDGLPGTAFSAGVVAPASAMLSAEAIEGLYASFFGHLYPDLKDDALSLVRDAYAGMREGAVSATFPVGDGRNINLVAYRPEDADEMLAIIQESFELHNRMVEATVDDPGYRFEFVGEPLEELEGFERFRLVFADPEWAEEVVDELNDEYNLGLDFSQIRDLVICVGARGDAVFVLSGQIREGEMAELFEIFTAGDREFIELAGADGALAWVEASQAGFGLVAADGVVPALARQLALAGSGDGGLSVRALEKAAPDFVGGGEVFAVSSGVAGGALTLRGYFPAAAVNTVLRDYEAFDRARGELSGGGEGDGEEDDGDADVDAYDYDEDEEGYEDGDMTLDGPAEAS